MTYFFKNTEKDIILTKEDERDYSNFNSCRFCEKNIESDKVREHCHFTGYYRGSAHNTCIINVTQEQILFHLCFTIFVTMIVNYFLRS